MKNNNPDMQPDRQQPGTPTVPGTGRMKCEDIQSILFEFMRRELGGARSDLVREHLVKCPECRAAASEIQFAVKMLETAAAESRSEDAHLSTDRRRRIRRAFMHPLLGFIYRHHFLVSLLAAFVVLAVIICLLWNRRIWFEGNDKGAIPLLVDPSDGSFTIRPQKHSASEGGTP